MITAGIDCGTQNTKAVLLQDGKILGKATSRTEFDAQLATQNAFDAACRQAGIAAEDVETIIITGSGRDIVTLGNGVINEVNAAAKGVFHTKPDTRLIIDIGAETCRAIKMKESGAIDSYEVNDKCASGAGTFIETMARTLAIPTEEIGAYAMRHTKEVPMNAQCVVFVESEVISLIHQQTAIEDIAYGVLSGIANRILSLARRVGITSNVMLIGGPAHNIGLVHCLEKELGEAIEVPDNNDYISAIGAAVHGAALQQAN